MNARLRPRALATALIATLLACGAGPTYAHSRIPPPTTREKATLSGLSDATPARELLRLLSSDSYHVGLKSALMLAQRKDADTVTELIDVMQTPVTVENRYGAYFALVALCKMGDVQAAKPIRAHAKAIVDRFLNELIPSEADQKTLSEIREAYCRMVTHGRPPAEQAKALADHLDAMPDWVGEALAALGPAGAPILMKKVRDADTSPSLRCQSIRSLGRAGSSGAVPLLEEILRAKREDPIRGGSDQLVGEAASALIALAGAEGLGAVKAAFAQHKGWLTRVYIVRSLGALADPSALQWLQEVAANPKATADTVASRKVEDRIEAIRDHAHLSAAKIEHNVSEDRTATLLQLLAHPHPWVRTYAAQNLLGLQDERILKPALEALEDTELKVRQSVIETLGLLGNTQAIEPLKEILNGQNIGDHMVARRALENLGMTVVYVQGKYHVFEPDLAIFAGLRSESPIERQRTVKELLLRGKEGGHLIAAAFQSPDRELQAAGEAALEELKSRIKDGEAGSAARAISALGGAGARGLYPLLEALKDLKSARLRRQIAEALASGDDMAVPTIAAAISMAQSQDAEWVPDLFHALSLAGKSGVFMLKRHAEGTNALFRGHALRALSGTAGEEVIAIQIKALGDRDNGVRRTAISILGNLEAETLIALLLAELQAKDERTRAGAALLCSQYGTTAKVLPVAEALVGRASDPVVRRDAISSFRLLRGYRSVFPLLRATADPDATNALEADSALLSLEDSLLVEAVERKTGEKMKAWGRWIRSEDAEVRAIAALLTPEANRDEASGLLLSWARDFPFPVAIVHALGETGGKKAEAFLLGALRDPCPVIRRAAARSLGQLGSRAALGPLRELLKDRESTVRLAARKALGRIEGR